MAVGLKTISEQAGVSISTVSHILAGRGQRYAADTRKAVLEGARKLNYKPNPAACALRGGRTNTVGMIGPVGSLGGDIAHSFTKRARVRGYVTYLADHMSDLRLLWEALADFARRRVDGVVVRSPGGFLYEKLAERLREFPAAVAMVKVPAPVQIDQMVVDIYPAFHAVVDHFAKTGRRQPGIVFGDPQSDKVKTFVDRFKQHGIEVSPQAIIDFDWNLWQRSPPRAIYQSLDVLFPTGRVPFDALFLLRDDMAVAAMTWLKAHGYQIPRDVAVVGFANENYSQYLDPPLASIHPSNEEVLDAMEKMLFARLENPDLPPQREDIPMEFVWRESAG